MAAMSGGPTRAGTGHPCAAISDNTARLTCYDEAFGRPATAAPAPVSAGAPTAATAATAASAATVAVPVAAATAQTAEQQFGLSQQQARATAPKPVETKGPEKIQSAATEIKRKPLGELVISLENGQVWEQTEVDSTVHIKPGDPVTVSKAAFGSFMMTSGHSTLRVRRIR